MDRNSKRFLYCVFGGLVNLAVNIYHFTAAIRDGVPFFPLANLYGYEISPDILFSLAGYFAIIGGAWWAGILMVIIYKSVGAVVANRNVGSVR